MNPQAGSLRYKAHLDTATGGTTLGGLPLPGGEGWVRAELVFPRFLVAVSRCALRYKAPQFDFRGHRNKL
jgi:hypothetical protein